MKLAKKIPLDSNMTLLIQLFTHINRIFFSCTHFLKNLIHTQLQKVLLKETVSLFSQSRRQSCQLGFGCNIKQSKDNPQKWQTEAHLTTTTAHNGAPLIKTYRFSHLCHQKEPSLQNDSKNVLIGRTILCVGGRAPLYPQYHRLVASLDAHLLIYRSSIESSVNRLYTLLDTADMIICPIDCINHNDFFAVQCYCKFSKKPYILLDRSNLITFNQGIKALIGIAASKPTRQTTLAN